MNLKNFISELKRRNVFKVATAYAIAGWLIIQIVTAIDEPLSLPDWFDTAVIVLVFIGFPIALIIGWAFELTADGIKKSNEVEITSSVTSSTGKKLNRLIIAVLSLAVLFLVINRVFYAQSTSSSSDEMASIAVLPFADMSPQSDQEYFSDGLAEELLNVLAKVEDIKVAGRTSSFKYKGVNDDLKKIGEHLGVDHILEGSVRKSGDNIRITAQLINVEDGFHIWTETYDRKYSVENIFEIQDEISNKVLKELKVKLLGVDIASETKKVATKNTEAYEAYLKGIQLSRNFQPKDIEKAIDYLNNAITLDPKFSLAYSRLTIAYSRLERYGSMNLQEAIGSIIYNANKAILLDNTSGMAHAAVAYSYLYQRKFDEAVDAISKAYELEPNNPEIVLLYATSINENKELKTELIKKAYSIDPLSPLTIAKLGSDYYNNENYVKAQEMAEKNVAINPDYVKAHRNLVRLLRDSPNGKLDEAFMSAYAAYKQFPENLEILVELAFMAIDLHLYDFVDDLVVKITLLYPENNDILGVKRENYFHQNDMENYAKTGEEFFEKFDSKEDKSHYFRFRLNNFYYADEIGEAINFIESYHPIYLSDTLSSVPNNKDSRLAHATATLKHSGDLKQVNRLAEIYCNKITSEFEYNGDLKKEKLELLYDYSDCACLSGNGKLASEIIEEVYFNRKSKASTYDTVLNNMLTDLISETPEFKALAARITTDINIMKQNTIEFLKAENAWIED